MMSPNLIHRFQQHVKHRPNSIAVQDDSLTLTYHELDQWSNVLAQIIFARCNPMESHAIVAVCMSRSTLLLTSVLAIVKCGFAYVPLDPLAPIARIEGQISQCGAQLLLVASQFTNEQHLPLFELAISMDVATIVTGSSIDAHQQATPPGADVSNSDLLAILFTSGSTGTPKGVLIEHASMINLVDGPTLEIEAGDHVALTANPSFDAASFEIWNSLVHGATIFIMTAHLADTDAVAAFFREKKIQKAFIPTAVFHRLFSDASIAASLDPTLRMLNIGGEKLSTVVVQTFLKHAPNVRLTNGYGSTETTICATLFEVTKDAVQFDDGLGKPIPIGTPIPNTQVFLLNDDLREVEFGQPGEICVAGAALTRGYVDLIATSTKFTTISGLQGSSGITRIYRTGDIGKMVSTSSGAMLEYVGRNDNQSKIRGQRFEPGEIESVICSERGDIGEAAVIVTENDKMIAFVVKQKEGVGLSTQTSGWDEFQGQFSWENIDSSLTGMDFTGWVSMYDGLQIPQPAMEEWLADTIDAIPLQSGDSVLEVGCGTGMILFSIESRCKDYVGIDMSGPTLAFVQAQIAHRGLENKIRTIQGMADQLPQLLPVEDRFDLIIFNSVLQYFPSSNYLETLLSNCVDRLKEGGRIFLGDIRGLGVDKHHDLASVLHCDPSANLSSSEIEERLEMSQDRQKEFKVNPSFFFHLRNNLAGRISHIEVLPKMMNAKNELSQFRYQVVLHVGSNVPAVFSPMQWIQYTTSHELENMLATSCEETLALMGIPNSFVAREEVMLQLLENNEPPSTARELAEAAIASDWCTRALSPRDVTSLAARYNWHVELSWKSLGTDRTLAALFSRESLNTKVDFSYCGIDDSPCNTPVEPTDTVVQSAKKQDLVISLRAVCRDKLPSYMIPNHFIQVDSLPLTSNGKVDRKLLAHPSSWKDHISAEAREMEMCQPRNETEARVQKCVGGVLDIDPSMVPLHANLIELGLHSFRTPKLLSALRAEFNFDGLAYATVYKCANVAALGAYLELQAPKKNAASVLTTGPTKRREVAYDQEALDKVLHSRGFTMEDVEDVFETNVSQRLPFEEPIPGFCMSHESWTVHTDIDTLISALKTVISRQGVLRSTSFSVYTRQVVFRYSKKICDEVIRVHDAEKVPSLHTILEDPASYAYVPPETWWRFNIIKTEPLSLFCCFHQSTLDGWGRQVLFEEIESVILGHILPDPVPFRNFIDYAVNEWTRESSARWLADRLSKLDAIPFPACDENAAYCAASVLGPNFERKENLTGLTNVTNIFGIHSSTLLKVAISLVMRNQTKRNSVAFGQVQFGRNAAVEGVTQICGMLINCLVDCVDFRPDETVLDLLRRVQTAQDELMDRSLVNFDEVLRYTNRDFNPFFNFIWNLRTRREPIRTVLEAGPLGFDTPVAMQWTVIVDGDEVKIETDYDPSFATQIPIYTNQFFNTARWLIVNLKASGLDGLQME